jgi:hypothetical protein
LYFCSVLSVTVNNEGGADSRVLAWLLMSCIERLYQDAKDALGLRVLIRLVKTLECWT